LAASYFIGKEYERLKNWSSSIAYYSKAKCFSIAIKIAKEHRLDKELLQLSLQSTPIHMNDVARYLEMKGENEKSLLLYREISKNHKM
jgi:intraflagellar transport protein 140